MAFDPNAPNPAAAWSWAPPEWSAPVDLEPMAPPPLEVTPPLTPEEEAQIEIDPITAPPPTLQADAISSPAPSTVEQSLAQTGANVMTEAPAPPSLEEQAQPSDAPLPSAREREDQEGGEQLGVELSKKSPEEQAMFLAKLDASRDNFRATRVLEESAKVRDAAEQNARTREESIKSAQQRAATLDMEARAIADTNPTDAIPGYKKLFGVLASVLGGLTMHKTGRNVGLEAIDAIANEAAQQQQLKLQTIGKQRAGIGDQVAAADDAYRAAEAVRLATYDTAIKALESEVQQFDPRGSTAARVLGTLNDVKAKRAEALAKYTVEQQKRLEEVLKQQREVAELQEKQRHNLATEAADRTRAGADYLRAKTDAEKAKAETGAPLAPDQLAQLYGVTDPTLVPPIPMNGKQYEKWLETKTKAGQATKSAREASEDEQVRQFGVGELVDVEGKPLKFRNAETGAKVAKAKSSADLSVQLIDRLLDARDDHGWSSDLFKSPEWREMQSDFAQLILEKKNLDELGVIAGPDMDLMQKALGTKDPTEFRDPAPGLERIRKTTIEKTNSLVRAEAPAQKPRRWEPPPRAPKAPKSASDTEFQSLKAYDPGKDPGLAGDVSASSVDAARDPQFATRLAEASRVDAPLPDRIKSRVDRIYALANSPKAKPEERAAARAQLTELGDSAEFAALRDYAAFLSTMTVGGDE